MPGPQAASTAKTPGRRQPQTGLIQRAPRARLFHRGDERLPRLGGHAQRRPSAILGVSHHHGLISAGDFYALATVRT
jgi:hypothetical protein